MNPAESWPAAWLVFGIVLCGGGAALSAALIFAMRPLLLRYALARPSARGLHSTPTPQGGGIAVLLACAAVALAGGYWADLPAAGVLHVALVLAIALALAAVGLVDDVKPLPALPRLLLQLVCMALGVALLPSGTRVFPLLPAAVEWGLLAVAGTWFINLTNFMDGMDGITVADAVPVTAALVAFCASGELPLVAGLLALGLLGGLLGYAPFNKPVARLFLGDVGSLPIGFLLAFGLFSLAGNGGGASGQLGAAILLPLYPIADSGITLLWRIGRRERVWEPHRSHFYQVAVLRGAGVWTVLARVAAVNTVLAVLAWVCMRGNPAVQAAAVLTGVACVALTLLALTKAAPKGGG